MITTAPPSWTAMIVASQNFVFQLPPPWIPCIVLDHPQQTRRMKLILSHPWARLPAELLTRKTSRIITTQRSLLLSTRLLAATPAPQQQRRTRHQSAPSLLLIGPRQDKEGHKKNDPKSLQIMARKSQPKVTARDLMLRPSKQYRHHRLQEQFYPRPRHPPPREDPFLDYRRSLLGYDQGAPTRTFVRSILWHHALCTSPHVPRHCRPLPPRKPAPLLPFWIAPRLLFLEAPAKSREMEEDPAANDVIRSR
mmetsp:Transcript_118218/g.331069  ORF Transcript_118218/g.331069 Transcript_118218/m.331069 type:complete len:251 (+) Transcript_118218:577-1329(+)